MCRKKQYVRDLIPSVVSDIQEGPWDRSPMGKARLLCIWVSLWALFHLIDLHFCIHTPTPAYFSYCGLITSYKIQSSGIAYTMFIDWEDEYFLSKVICGITASLIKIPVVFVDKGLFFF